MGPDVRPSVRPTPFVDLTDVTMADEDTNSTLTDNANRAIQGNASYATWWPTLQTMQMVPTDDQILNQCKLCRLLAKFVEPSGGQISVCKDSQVLLTFQGSLKKCYQAG